MINLQDIWVAIPVYNNGKTILNIANECKEYSNNIIVVDDGSIDVNLKELFKDQEFVVIQHKKNKGKGKAILSALEYAKEENGKYLITIDGDGQLFPKDLLVFINKILETQNESSLFIGHRNFNTDNVPKKSEFGRKFANFWLKIETGVKTSDSQSGFRAYPVKYISQLKFFGNGYNFEAEVLAKSAWAGINLIDIPISVYYPPSNKRVSSFKPFKDNLKLSMMHSHLVGLSLTPFYKKRLVNKEHNYFYFFKHPVRFCKTLLKENATPIELATAAAIGTLLAVLPLIGCHTVLILYFSTKLHLNKVMAINIQHLYMPPFVPAMCIALGYYIRNGEWLLNVSTDTIVYQFKDRLYEWLLGSLLLAPIFAILSAIIVYGIAKLFSCGIQKSTYKDV